MTTRRRRAVEPTRANLTWPEIRARAAAFARDWADDTSERAEAQTFWNEFFAVFGVQRRRVAIYEKRAERFGKIAKGRIDVFWPGTLLAEHKSAGQDLDAAFVQATDYFAGLRDDELPRHVVVSDFQRFRLHDLDEGTQIEFPLRDLPKHIQMFGFIAGFARVRLREEPEANIRAVQRLGGLHDALKRNRYGLDSDGRAGHPLQMFLVRVLFCLFADDTGLFSPKDSFRDLIEATREDGSDTGAELARLFQVLDTPISQRQASLADKFAPFPHINGKLFEEALSIPEFDADMRRLLLICCDLQWAGISPAIFGAMFQKVIELDARDRRRQLGAHYTSETNILKLIGPLFLDDLRAEFERVRHQKDALFAFHKKLTTLHFLDPACGCGNFLVITYRELRRLELDVLQAARAFGEPDLETVFGLFKVGLQQFHGIEIEEFPAQVAQVAMWLTQHQMDLIAGEAFGTYFKHLPLEQSAHIRHGNALQLDWEAFVPPSQLDYILGNPPFVGAKLMSDAQREDFAIAAKGVAKAGLLDYVSAWYIKAAQYLSGSKEGFASPDKRVFTDVEFASKAMRVQKKNAEAGIEDIFVAAERADAAARDKIRCAFVSTNSITQGEQVGVLWSELLRRGMHIQFAHRAFKWSNEAPGKAAVHCVIIGFGREDIPGKQLFDYSEIDGPAHKCVVANINPYLVDGPDVLLSRRDVPLSDMPEIGIGNKPIDGGHYLFTTVERDAFLAIEPGAAKWFRRWLGSDEFINGWERWCLWLGDCPPDELRQVPEAAKRVEAVRKFRLASKSAPTRKIAATPTRFHVEKLPMENYLLIPKVSSERRPFIPIGFESPTTLASDLVFVVPEATLHHFGVLTSTMHMAWVRAVCGRLESRYRYSAQVVYNNFPWPQQLTDAQRSAIESCAQGVLDARAAHPGATLADLYDPDTMPPNLVVAHRELDRAVDAAYRADGGPRSYAGDAERVAFLFRRYAQLTNVI
jgi:hypothetical protein